MSDSMCSLYMWRLAVLMFQKLETHFVPYLYVTVNNFTDLQKYKCISPPSAHLRVNHSPVGMVKLLDQSAAIGQPDLNVS